MAFTAKDLILIARNHAPAPQESTTASFTRGS